MALLVVSSACGKDSDDANVGDPAPTTPECGGETMQPPNVSNCNDEQLAEYHECADDACHPVFEECYGPSYEQGVYSGTCAPYIECIIECGCGDQACIAACEGAAECGQCLSSTCALECLPNCGGHPGDPTCDDLAACCAALQDPATRADCQLLVDESRQLGAMGDSFCAILYPTVAPQCA